MLIYTIKYKTNIRKEYWSLSRTTNFFVDAYSNCTEDQFK
jgi:hypothetical protein